MNREATILLIAGLVAATALVFYTARQVQHVSSEYELMQLARTSGKVLIVVNEKNYESLSPDLEAMFNVERRSGKFVLLIPKLADQQ